MGQPSATSVLASIEENCGGYGGMGQPSALSVPSIVMGLPAERLTDRTTGSTIRTAKTETATTNAVFFKGSSPPGGNPEEGQFWRVSVLESVPNAEHLAP
jgi:hypothetical protein